MKERYTVKMDFYIWADDDKDAVRKARMIVRKMEKKEDNQPELLSVHRTPFACLTATAIYDKEKPIEGRGIDLNVDDEEMGWGEDDF